ncbi:glycosyltransferase family 2 protein [Cellulomonas sp. ACRRI]|uniref:glycosyltransferase family A protein n=1 Tax=Cellulomonas sp. ACRRI TaxID=2918188 RepID=UPI001EF1F178|nr:glycosyltransferase family A protein [Cellulomonas sp. ACRRI]MCG7284888.1 glycosyltransferase family 2 protein [Cellulomonas sp. ACRRI]
MTGRPPLRISVVVPARDEEDRLPRCLASLAAQTRLPDEVVVVDNASTDATARLAAAAGARVVHEAERGIWPAAAAGYDAATGDVIARVDADTVLPPDWLARVEALLTDDPGCAAVTGPGRFRLGPADATERSRPGGPGLGGRTRLLGGSGLLGRLGGGLAHLLYMRAYFVLGGLALGGPPVFGSACAVRTAAWRAARHEVHREADVHDDLDLSFHLPPGSVRYDAGLAVSISARPLRSPRGLGRRLARGWRSVVLHWPEQAPWRAPGRRAAWWQGTATTRARR